MHEKDESAKASRQISRSKFFVVVLACSFAWYAVPGYLFPTLTSISWLCWVFSKSVTAQQLGSGMKGLGLFAFTLDWSTVSSFLFSPLISPFFATANIFVGYVVFVYVIMPMAYWGFDLYSAKTFPIFSSHLWVQLRHHCVDHHSCRALLWEVWHPHLIHEKNTLYIHTCFLVNTLVG